MPEQWAAKVAELRALATTNPSPSLGQYLDASELDLDDVYGGGRSWSDLQVDAGLPTRPAGAHEEVVRRAIGRLLHVDDRVRIDGYRRLLGATAPSELQDLGERNRRLLRMLVASLLEKAVDKTMSIAEGAAVLLAHPQVCAEVRELLDVLAGRIQHVAVPLEDDTVPLQVHARYTRREILAAFGIGQGAKVAPWQTGVYWAKEARADLLAFTLDKTSGQFSPTTRYRDHAISRDLIHWESQSVTRADSETGRRYQEHVRRGSRVMLFARLRADERAFYFLGPASYVSHEGELPMAITWRLARPLPGDLYASFAAAVA